MKYKGFDSYILEPGEPMLRSCWECNGAHRHLKEAKSLHCCFVCGRYFIFGKFLDEFESTEELDEFLKERLAHVEDDHED